MPAAFDPTPRIAEAAAKHGINTIYGTIEPLSHNEGTAHNLICMAYGDGRAPVSYRRTHPNGPWIYTGGKWWEFQYVPGNEFPVFDTAHGKVGLAMCSEAYMPEVTRALALRGAELIFMPAGTDKGKLWATWRNLIWSRAIENLAIVVTTQNLFSNAERGLAMVAAPEEILFETTAAGLFFVDVSLARAREMRAGVDSVDLFAEFRRQAGRAGAAMATAGTARIDISAATARSRLGSVMAGLDPAIHDLQMTRQAGYPAQAGHDELGSHHIALIDLACEFPQRCPLAPISAPNRALATRKAASSAPPSAAPTMPPSPHWRRSRAPAPM